MAYKSSTLAEPKKSAEDQETGQSRGNKRRHGTMDDEFENTKSKRAKPEAGSDEETVPGADSPTRSPEEDVPFDEDLESRMWLSAPRDMHAMVPCVDHSGEQPDWSAPKIICSGRSNLGDIIMTEHFERAYNVRHAQKSHYSGLVGDILCIRKWSPAIVTGVSLIHSEVEIRRLTTLSGRWSIDHKKHLYLPVQIQGFERPVEPGCWGGNCTKLLINVRHGGDMRWTNSKMFMSAGSPMSYSDSFPRATVGRIVGEADRKILDMVTAATYAERGGPTSASDLGTEMSPPPPTFFSSTKNSYRPTPRPRGTTLPSTRATQPARSAYSRRDDTYKEPVEHKKIYDLSEKARKLYRASDGR